MAKERMTGAKVIVRALEEEGVEWIFGVPGGAVLPMYDELFNSKKVKHVLVRHEQTGAHAAEGYAQDRKSTRLNSSHIPLSRMPSSA